MSDFIWVSCSIAEFGHIGEFRHLIIKGRITTVCGNSASHPEIWRKSSVKVKCNKCESVEDSPYQVS